MTFDEKLAQALGETFDERMEQRFAVTKKHRFSLAYKLWEHKTLKNLRKNRYEKRWTLRRTRYIVMAAIVVLALLLGATSCAVAAIGRYSFVTRADHMKLLWLDVLPSDKKYIKECYILPEDTDWQPGQLPKSSELSENLASFRVLYKCNERKVIFEQTIIAGGTLNTVRAKNAVFKGTSVYEKNDGLFMDCGDGKCHLYWTYDGYFFKLDGNITKNEAINLAQSIKILEM